MTQIAWAIFLAAVIGGDAVRYAVKGGVYDTQSSVSVMMGIAMGGLMISSIVAALR